MCVLQTLLVLPSTFFLLLQAALSNSGQRLPHVVKRQSNIKRWKEAIGKPESKSQVEKYKYLGVMS